MRVPTPRLTSPNTQLRHRSDVIQQLQERIHGIEGSRCSLSDRDAISTGFPELDRLLTDGGLRRGTLVEWLGEGEGSGVATFALSVAVNVLVNGGAFVVIDEAGEFYPVAAAHAGIPLERTIIVRPNMRATALWAWERAMGCPGVAVTFGRIGAVDERLFRRLQLSAETGGGLGFLVRAPGAQGGASWGATCICARPYAPGGNTLSRRLRVSVTRGQSAGRATEIELESYHETNNVSIFSKLADPVANDRAAVG